MFNVKLGYPNKKAYIFLLMLLGVPNVKATYQKSWPENLFHMLNLTFDPSYKVKWGYHTKLSSHLPYYWS